MTSYGRLPRPFRLGPPSAPSMGTKAATAFPWRSRTILSPRY